jgi:hypothetical protein
MIKLQHIPDSSADRYETARDGPYEENMQPEWTTSYLLFDGPGTCRECGGEIKDGPGYRAVGGFRCFDDGEQACEKCVTIVETA